MRRYHLVLLVRGRSAHKTTPPFGHPSKGGELPYHFESTESFVSEGGGSDILSDSESEDVPDDLLNLDNLQTPKSDDPHDTNNPAPANSENITTESAENRNSPPLEGCPKGGVARVRVRRNSQAYFNLPCNPALKAYAKAHRKSYNLSEVLFWNQVKRGKFKGYDFDRQKITGNYIADFYCANCGVVIEIDGSSHDHKQAYDAKRDAYLQSLGLVVIHIPVREVLKRMKKVMAMLERHPALVCSV